MQMSLYSRLVLSHVDCFGFDVGEPAGWWIVPMAGVPATVVPMAFDDSMPVGLPTSIQMLARPFAEPTLISIGYAFEQLTKFRRYPAGFPECRGIPGGFTIGAASG